MGQVLGPKTARRIQKHNKTTKIPNKSPHSYPLKGGYGIIFVCLGPFHCTALVSSIVKVVSDRRNLVSGTDSQDVGFFGGIDGSVLRILPLMFSTCLAFAVQCMIAEPP